MGQLDEEVQEAQMAQSQEESSSQGHIRREQSPAVSIEGHNREESNASPGVLQDGTAQPDARMIPAYLLPIAENDSLDCPECGRQGLKGRRGLVAHRRGCKGSGNSAEGSSQSEQHVPLAQRDTHQKPSQTESAASSVADTEDNKTKSRNSQCPHCHKSFKCVLRHRPHCSQDPRNHLFCPHCNNGPYLGTRALNRHLNGCPSQ